MEINMKEKINEIKIEQVVTNLETMKKENMDIYDIAAVVIMDIHDMMIANTNEKFKKEKSDLKKQLKVLKRVINNKTFKGVKHFKK
jgi:uncharacterized tellurite resistance protein B-like protein